MRQSYRLILPAGVFRRASAGGVSLPHRCGTQTLQDETLRGNSDPCGSNGNFSWGKLKSIAVQRDEDSYLNCFAKSHGLRRQAQKHMGQRTRVTGGYQRNVKIKGNQVSINVSPIDSDHYLNYCLIAGKCFLKQSQNNCIYFQKVTAFNKPNGPHIKNTTQAEVMGSGTWIELPGKGLATGGRHCLTLWRNYN